MQETTDLLNEWNSSQEKFWADCPEQMSAFMSFMGVAKKAGALEAKSKDLIALATAITAQCEWCIAVHVKGALADGATKEEILEASWMAVLMGGGPSLMYMQVVQKALEDLLPQS